MIPLRRFLAASALLMLVCLVSGCSTTPDKRLLQYLNTDGFGNRYTGNAEEENYVTIGGTIGITDSYNPQDLSVAVSVDIDGTVLLPDLGAVHVAGLTRTQIEALLTEKYSAYYDRLDIQVSITAGQKKYFVFGEATGIGEQPFLGDLTVFEAVMRASPERATANLGRVRLIRADPRDPFVMRINIGEMFDSGDSTFNTLVKERDIIYIPPNFFGQLANFLETLLEPVRRVIGVIGGGLLGNNNRNGRGNGGFGGGGFGGGGIFSIF